MKRHNTVDRAAWHVQVGADDPIRIETTNGATWALRALMAAGNAGLYPIDTGGGRWAHLVDRLRESGVSVEDLPDDDNGRRGYRLAATVKRVG
jgi:hypothetical protein